MFIEVENEMSTSSVGAKCMTWTDMVLLRSYGAVNGSVIAVAINIRLLRS
jgi:hypothetical protein